MQKLVRGLHQFQEHVFAPQREKFGRLVDGQQPLALFITCSDSRICPNLLTQTEPGELFILRNAGNIIPPHSHSAAGEAATIEYALSVLKVTDVIVCGHTCCGAMALLLNPASIERLPAISAWLSHAEATRRIIEENYTHLTDPHHRLVATVEENVLVQLENLRTHPAIAAAVGRHAVTLHGWVYKLETGRVFAYHPQHGQFEPLVDTSVVPRALEPAELSI